MPATVTISIYAPNAPVQTIPGIQFYPGITVLGAMVIAQALDTTNFNFRVLYHSQYGAFVDMIDDDEDQGGNFWLLYVGGKMSDLGVAEAILQPGDLVEWKFGTPSAATKRSKQSKAKTVIAKSKPVASP